MLSKAEAKRDGARAGKAAASWMDPGDERSARRLAKMIDDGDPAIDQYLPRRPDLSGEYAGESMNEILDVQDGDDPDAVDEIADIWQEAADEAFDAEVGRIIMFAANFTDDEPEEEEDDEAYEEDDGE